MTDKTFWHRIQEPIFDKQASFNCEAYRFTWTRTFHPLIILRVVNEGGKIVFSGKELKQDLSITLKQHEEFELNGEQWQSVLDEVERQSLWSYQSTPNKGIDGAHWRLECLRYGQIQDLYEWCPAPENPLRKFCLALVTLSGFELTDSEIY